MVLPLVEPRSGVLIPPGGCHMRKKSPYLRTGSHLEYGGEGGIDSLRSPLLGPSLGLAPAGPTQALFKNAPGVFVGAARLLRARSVQLAAPVVEPRSGVLIPPAGATCEKKARTCVQALISNMAVRGGLTRFARPCGAARSHARRLSNWLRQLSNPGRRFSSPPAENIKEKSPYLRTGSHLEYGGEGGIDSLRSPLRGSPLAGSPSVQLAAPVVEPRSGVLIPPCGEYKRKEPVLAYRLSSRIWR